MPMQRRHYRVTSDRSRRVHGNDLRFGSFYPVEKTVLDWYPTRTELVEQRIREKLILGLGTHDKPWAEDSAGLLKCCRSRKRKSAF